MTQTAQKSASRDAHTGELLDRIGQLTRALHDSMRELGLDKEVERAAEAIPDARDRLSFIADTTEQAAQRTLSAVEIARPVQSQIGVDAAALDRRWQQWFDEPAELGQARQIVRDTRAFLQRLPGESKDIDAQLLDILMAQEFQDLTGQVVKRLVEVIVRIEQQLVGVLLDHLPDEPRQSRAEPRNTGAGGGLINGPQIAPEARADVVANQDQVDDLLDSLGF